MRYLKRRLALPLVGQGMGQYKWGDQHISTLLEGIGLGMNFIDTAEDYDNGRSEIVVGKVAKQVGRDKLYIGTKFAPQNSRMQDIIKSLDGSLRRMGTDYVDIYQMHWLNPVIPFESTCSGLKKLRRQGKIKHVGMSNLNLEKLRDAHNLVGLSTLQIEYNLFDRSIEHEILPYCQSNDITVIAYSPLDQGRIADGDSMEVIEEIARSRGVTPSQVALSWVVSHDHVIAIPKATNVDHLRQNAQAIEFELTPKERHMLDSVKTPIELVDTDDIRVILEGQNNRKTYQTLDEALENKLGFIPSPESLSETINPVRTRCIKPVRLIKSTSSDYEYDLVEGRIRYWAWVLACRRTGQDLPIPAYVRKDWK